MADSSSANIQHNYQIANRRDWAESELWGLKRKDVPLEGPCVPKNKA